MAQPASGDGSSSGDAEVNAGELADAFGMSAADVDLGGEYDSDDDTILGSRLGFDDDVFQTSSTSTTSTQSSASASTSTSGISRGRTRTWSTSLTPEVRTPNQPTTPTTKRTHSHRASATAVCCRAFCLHFS